MTAARRDELQPIKTILVPTDFSPHAEGGLRYATDLAKRLGARVHILHALHVPAAVVPSAEWWTTLRSAALAGLAHARKIPDAASVPCEVELSDQHPVDAIHKIAEQIRADVIVMGSRGATGLEHVLLGSVAERTIRHAPCPVLTLSAHALRTS
jgi:nucleotide-binding universal stress UspA family protein